MIKPDYIPMKTKWLHEEKGPFETAVKRYEIFPTTVWNVRDSDPTNRRLKSLLGDNGATRTNPKSEHGYKRTMGRNKAGATTSIFPPATAIYILNLFCPPDSKVFDPFAGGGCRAVLAAMAGHQYTGVEIRDAEVESINTLCKKHGVADQVTIIHGDARNKNGLPADEFDFCYTCPPYWNLEQYEGGDSDLSMIDNYDEFTLEMAKVVAETKRVLKPGSLSCWVVGLHRKRNQGNVLAPLHHDIARLHVEQGFDFQEEILIYRNNPVALRRAGNFEKGKRLLIRQHEYCLIFERK